MRSLFFFFILLLISPGCKHHFYRASSGSMEGTIMLGESFYVRHSDQFKRNDIVVFDHLGEDYTSIDENGKFKLREQKKLYRLIAMSGDVVEIHKGEVFVNRKHIPLPPKAKMDYEIASLTPIDELFKDKEPKDLNIDKSGDTIKYIARLSTEEAMILDEKKPPIVSVKKKVIITDIPDTLYARASENGNWSQDNYGPLKIPSAGDTIFVTPVNFKLYHNIPNIHQGANLVKEKLYFVLGDNRHEAEDSRFIGLISQSKMYGVVN